MTALQLLTKNRKWLGELTVPMDRSIHEDAAKAAFRMVNTV